MTNSSATFFLRNLAAALIEGEWTGPALLRRARRAWPSGVPRRRGWLANIRKTFPEKPDFHVLADWLDRQPEYRGAMVGTNFEGGRGSPIDIFLPAVEQTACKVPVTGELPHIKTFGQLAQHLGLTAGQLTVYADIQRLNRDRSWSDQRCPYRYATVSKRGYTPQTSARLGRELRIDTKTMALLPPDAEGKVRLLEIPKRRLKRVQRRIIDDILALLPLHPAAHGFAPGRSILTNAALHAGREVVIRFDLKDFFPSVPATRVRGVFAKLGFPQSVSRMLMGLCTTVCPENMEFADPKLQELSSRPHLPQGAPTSPALANLCAYRLDCRLSGLARRFGATYTRYADDLTFSGDHELRRTAQRLRKWVVRIVTEEGFTLNAAKTRVKSRSDRQTVTGLVVNVKPNVRRKDFDTLKAILTNCVRHGPASQNRDKVPHFRDHLLGRVAFVASVHPAHGLKLRAIFERIAWPASA